MNLFAATRLTKSYGDKTLLDNVSFGIEDDERIGLIGVNGTGKSTLLRIVAGLDLPDSGELALAGGAVVRYLPQDPVFDPELTIQDVLQAAELSFEARAILTRVGITDFTSRMGTLSGGQRKRVALTRALTESSDLLILDEPTNHIDDATVVWLEGFLQKRSGALLMVTHDRYFLERAVNRIFELDAGQLYRYPGNYEAFLEGKLLREESALATEQKRQNFLRNELTWIQRGARARSTKQKARSERYYETLEQSPQTGAGTVDLWTATSRLGQTVIDAEQISKGYSHALIRDFTYRVDRADRVGIVGPSGCGKSTLLRMLAGQILPDTGRITIGSTVRLGYYSQEQAPIDERKRVLEFVREQAHYVETQDGQTITAAQMLERFLFAGSTHWTPVGNLSGGERRRLTLLSLLIGAPNVLLLDEPTNDLDLATLAILEDYLEHFAGAVLVVSHDRYFVDRVCNKLLAFEGEGRIAPHFGGFSDYLARRTTLAGEEATGSDRLAGASSFATGEIGPQRKSAPRAPRFSYQEQQDYDSIDAVIAEVEEQLRLLSERLAHAGDDYDLTRTLFAEQQAAEQRLEQLLERWTYLQELAEAIAQYRAPGTK